MPTTMISRGQERETRREERVRQITHEQAREDALARLMTLLENPADTLELPTTATGESVRLHRLACLRAAHARYALSTEAGWKREGSGAFIRRRRIE